MQCLLNESRILYDLNILNIFLYLFYFIYFIYCLYLIHFYIILYVVEHIINEEYSRIMITGVFLWHQK